MKLSQIRLLSWGIALLGACACLLYGFKAYQKMKATKPNGLSPVEFKLTANIDDAKRGVLMENQRLMQALSFLMKVPPPPTPEKVVKPVEVKQVKTTAREVKPPPPIFDPKIGVVLISFDDENGRHLAFMKKEKEPSHPYLKGEYLPTDPKTKLAEIYRDHVIIKADDGRRKILYIKQAKVSNQKVVPNLAPPKATARKVIPATNKTVAAVPKTRRVPRSRKVQVNKDYGVSIIQYDDTPEGEKRFAVSNQDLKALQNQALRLMSEVSMQPAYDDSGQAKGIQLDFIADQPLAQSYGIKSGDILTHVDGKQVTNTYQAEGIYNNLGNKTRRVQMSIERGGIPFNVWFEMDDFPGTKSR